jgi:hypothetical protein
VGQHGSGQHQGGDRRDLPPRQPEARPGYLASFAYRFNRRRQLDSIVERLAWAATRTAPHPNRVVTADA